MWVCYLNAATMFDPQSRNWHTLLIHSLPPQAFSTFNYLCYASELTSNILKKQGWRICTWIESTRARSSYTCANRFNVTWAQDRMKIVIIKFKCFKHFGPLHFSASGCHLANVREAWLFMFQKIWISEESTHFALASASSLDHHLWSLLNSYLSKKRLVDTPSI